MAQDQCDLPQDLPKPNEDAIEGQKQTYEVLDLLGKGSFGAVFRVKRGSDDKLLAMKCETYKVKKQVLRHEAKVFLATAAVQSPHLIQLEDKGKVSGRFVFIVLRLVGRNLWDLRMSEPGKKFSMSTCLKVAEQSLAGLRDLHRAGFLHRDVKPPNFAIGREEDHTQHVIYILDFGLCRRYRTIEKDIRMPREKSAFRGTTRYASLDTLEQKEQSRKDDVESWWYMIVEMMLADLPWKKFKGTERAEVKAHKQQLRQGDNLKKLLANVPTQPMTNILLYLDTVEYSMIPDYDYVYRQLETAKQDFRVSSVEPVEWDVVNDYTGPKYEEGLEYNMKVPGDPSVKKGNVKSTQDDAEKNVPKD